MTNQEAIKRIKEHIAIHKYRESHAIHIVEALEMAISALQAQDVPDTNVGDTISRQAAINTDGLDEEIRCEMCRNQIKTDRGCDGNCKYDEKLYEKIMQILDKRITPLPPAQPEPSMEECACCVLMNKPEPCEDAITIDWLNNYMNGMIAGSDRWWGVKWMLEDWTKWKDGAQ